MSDAYFDKVSLCLPMNGSDGGTTFTDWSSVPKTITVYGDTHTEVDQSKYYGSSGYFDGTGDYLTVSNSTDFDFGTGDFTIRFWVYFSSNSGSQGVFAAHALLAGNAAFLFYLVSGELRFYSSSNGSSWDIASAVVIKASVASSTWYHIEVSRVGTSIRLFCDGVLANTITTSSGLVSTGANTPSIGQWATSNYFNGYIQDLEVHKGAGLHSANFTPPTALIKTISGTVKDETSSNVARTVVAFPRLTPTKLAQSTISDSGTGAFSFTVVDTEHVVLALDNDAGTQYNAIVKDRVAPV